jgi:HAE1 family hydrophobic/amphiphilic exporter-1
VGVVTPATSWILAQPQLVLQGVKDPAGTRLGLGGGRLEVSGLSVHPWMLSYRPALRRSPADLERWSQGTRASLAPERIDRDQGQRSLTVAGFYRKGAGGSMQLQMDWLMAARMQLAIPSNYQLELRGDMVLMMDSFARLTVALALAVVLIYLVLGLQFASFTLPLVLLASIPLELPGVVLGLLLTGQAFSSVSLLGLVVLHGMDLTASLLLVDAVWGRGRTKDSLDEALCEALPRRLLPIVLTATITVGVLLPLVLVPGGGFDAYAPLVTVIVGGLLSSTLLSLWVTPVLLRVHGGFASRPDELGATAQH